MPRTLQLFERAGICETFLAEVNRVHGVRFVTPRGAAYVGFANVRTRYPFVSILPQWKTEALLESSLRRLGGGVRYGHEFVSSRAHERGIRATVRTQRGTYTIAARYLAGCDGAHSAVREESAITFAGRSYKERSLLADAPVESVVPPDEARVHIDRNGMVTLFPMNAVLRRIVIAAPHEALPDRAGRDWLQERVDRAGLRGTIVGEPVWSSVFSVHRRVAQRMRRDCVFLAGDAAHAHSPVGGQGMNVGLEDAWTLAQTLSPVLRGQCSASTLDRYEAQRLPVARTVVRRTDLLLRALAHPNGAMRVGREFLAPYIIRIPVLRNRVVRKLLTA
jgi:2-polyprenyl-6-methoxyphenol hydroxylase-like FAD-dependent oxidoreductase